MVKLIIHLYNTGICKTKWIENQLEKGVFDDVRHEVCIRPLHCDVACFDCNG